MSSMEKRRHGVSAQKTIPKSSPLFQEFKSWQRLNDVRVKNCETKATRDLDIEEKRYLFEELNMRGGLTKKDALKLLFEQNRLIGI